MARYVDRLVDYSARPHLRHPTWCHLVADSDAELLACAAQLGIEPRWVQGSRGWDTHFDLTPSSRQRALALGASLVDFRFMGRRTRARRAAATLGADRSAGAPAGSRVEVPLPPGRWEPVASPAGVAASMMDDHPLVPGPAVALTGPDPVRGVVTLVDRHRQERLTVGLVLG